MHGTVLLTELQALIRGAREQLARAVNSVLVLVYCRVGSRIQTEILKNDRAEYGDQIVATVSPQLTAEFGSGFTPSALWRMIRFATSFPNPEIVAAHPTKLSHSPCLSLPQLIQLYITGHPSSIFDKLTLRIEQTQ